MSDPDDELQRPKEAAKLERFLGEWRVDGTMEMEGNIASISGTWTYATTADGWGVVGNMDTEIEGIGNINEVELIGYDSEHGKIHLFSMNRLAVRDHVGEWESQDTLVVEYRETHGSEIQSEILTIHFGSEQIKADVKEKVNGNVILATDLVLTRVR